MLLQILQDNIAAMLFVIIVFIAFMSGFEYRPISDKKTAIKKEKERQRRLPKAASNNNKK